MFLKALSDRWMALTLLAGLLVVAGASPAAVAAEPEVLFEDNFATLDPMLGTEDETLGVRDNTLFRVMEDGFWWRTFYEALLFEDVDVTVRVRVKDFASENGDAIGMAFWGINLNEFYKFEISDSGTYAIYRVTGNRWLPSTPWRSSDAIKTDSGAWNELRIVTSGNRATAFINGKEVASIKGRPPEGGGLIGFYYESGQDGSVGEFSQLKIAQGPEPAATDPADPNVLLVDDFATLDPNLGVADETLGIRDNIFFRKLGAGYFWRGFYESERFENVDATIRVRLQDFLSEQGNKIGLMFWGAGWDEYYLFEISDSGTYAVYRCTPDRWFVMSRWRDTDAINTDPEAWNDLRVVTTGGRATIFINGKELATVKGRPPAGGSMVGLYAESAEDGALSEFAALKVLRGPEPAENDLAADPNVLLADDFSTFDPGWGSEQSWFGVKDARLFIEFAPNEAYTALYQADAFNDVDATVNVRTVSNDPEGDAASGLAFWTDGGEDYYLLMLFRGGSIMVSRRVKDAWKQPLPARALPAEAKFDPNGGNKLRLVTAGSKATIYVNDVRIATISGQPPKGKFMFGLCAQSASKPSRSEFSELVVRKP